MIVAQALSSALASKFSSVGISGQKSPSEALAIASGVSDFVITLTANVSCIGSMGTGIASGNFIIPPTLGQVMVSSFTSYGLTGSAAQNLAYAIGSTVSEYISTNGIITAPTVIGGGGGTASFTTVSTSVLFNLLLSYLHPIVGDGEKQKNKALAIADGVCTSILASSSPMVVVGIPQFPFSIVPSISAGVVS